MIVHEVLAGAQKLDPMELDLKDNVLAAERTWTRRAFTWEAGAGGLYSCEVRLVAEPEGGFSAYVPQLPGVVSEGETVEEAREHIKEALAAAIESYREGDQDIPWQPPEIIALAEGEISRWVLVRV